MSQIEARILQQDYVLTCPHGQEDVLLAAVHRVDGDMERIRNTGKVRARERVGVLTAVNLAYENATLLARIEELEQALELAAHNAPLHSPTMPEVAPLASEAVQQLTAELHTTLAARDQDLLATQALIERLEAALETESKLL